MEKLSVCITLKAKYLQIFFTNYFTFLVCFYLLNKPENYSFKNIIKSKSKNFTCKFFFCTCDSLPVT